MDGDALTEADMSDEDTSYSRMEEETVEQGATKTDEDAMNVEEVTQAIEKLCTTDPLNTLLIAYDEGDVETVKRMLNEGYSVHETNMQGYNLLTMAIRTNSYFVVEGFLSTCAKLKDCGVKKDHTSLARAADYGHVDIIRLLIQHGADVNAEEQSLSGGQLVTYSPLMLACGNGHEDAARVLMDAGANVKHEKDGGISWPFIEAVCSGHVNIVKMLLDAGATLHQQFEQLGDSAFSLACSQGHLEMIKFLLEAGADLEHKPDKMNTPLMEAAEKGRLEVARLLLDCGAQVHRAADCFESPLMKAASGGHVDLALLLLERGADIDETCLDGNTPLMEASRMGHAAMVATLLGKGADVNVVGEVSLETALCLACCLNSTDVAELLIEAGASIELGAMTPLMNAAADGHGEIVEYLIHCGAKVDAQTEKGETALTFACRNGHTEEAEVLLKYNADVEHVSKGGKTPLMEACGIGCVCTVKLLLDKGANINQQNANNDHTPLSLACARGHLPVVELLLSRKADLDHKLKDNRTMISEAAKGGHTHVVQMLKEWPQLHIMVMEKCVISEDSAM